MLLQCFHLSVRLHELSMLVDALLFVMLAFELEDALSQLAVFLQELLIAAHDLLDLIRVHSV